MRPAVLMRPAALLPILAVLATATPARAQDFSAVSARPLPPETQVAHLWMGLPVVGVLWLSDWSRDTDLGASLRFDYLEGAVEPAFVLRHRLMGDRGWNLALRGRLGLVGNTGLTYADAENEANLGLRLAPEVVFDLRPHPTVTPYFTFEVPFLWSWFEGGGVRVPVLFGAGLELSLARDMDFVLYGSIGPRFESGEAYPGDTDLDGGVWLGLTFRLF